MYLKKFLARFVGLTVAGAVSAAKIRFVPWCGESFYFTSIVRGNMKTRKNGIIQSILLTLTLMVATLWVSSAVAAEKEMVKDPSTGMMVLKPQHGGTLTAVLLTRPYDHGDSWVTHGAGLVSGPVTDKIGQADWALDRSLNNFTTYWPKSAVTGHLAESWENPDPLTYIYKLRDNVFFHDKPPVNGRQLTADDLAANYDRLQGIGRFAGQDPAVHTWGTRSVPMESATATDKLTLVIKLSKPHPDTHRQLFDDCHIRAFPPETFDTLDDANELIGTGPFMMDEFVSATSITYDRNPNYWKDDEKFPGNRLPYVDKLVLLQMSDQATIIAALRSGQVDITGEMGVARIQSIASALELQKTNPGMQLFPIAFRNETTSGIKISAGGPLSDVRVRRALQMALDNETIRDTYFYGFGEWKAQGPIGPLWVGYHNAFDTWPEELQGYYSYDQEGAERLLDEADYPRGADGVRFRTSMWQNAARSDIGYHELQVGYWKKIGVEVELNVLDNATLLGKMNSGDWEGMTGWWNAGADYSQLDSGIGSYRSDGPVWGAYNDSVFDTKWQEVVAASSDENEYRRLAKKLDLYVLEQHFYIWGVKVPTFNVAQPWIVGYNGEMGIGNCGWEGPYNRLWIDSELKDELN